MWRHHGTSSLARSHPSPNEDANGLDGLKRICYGPSGNGPTPHSAKKDLVALAKAGA